MSLIRAALLLCVSLVALSLGISFYLPGVAPLDYARDDVVPVKVSKLSSTKAQLPYEYYSLPYCRPSQIISSAENLGEVLRGGRRHSLYQLEMRHDEQCKVICKTEPLSARQSNAFQAKIEDKYRVNMILDDLPVAMLKLREEAGVQIKSYDMGFPVGFKAVLGDGGEEKYCLHNHLRFFVLYHKDVETDLSRIVGFEVEPYSVKHQYEQPWHAAKPILETCDPGRMKWVTHGLAPQLAEENEEVVFTYDVIFKASDIKWASRWDTYSLTRYDQLHWFSIINSLLIVLFLIGMVTMIMMRTLRRDASKYNKLETC